MTTRTPSMEVTDNLEQSRFELRLDGELVGIEGYRVEGGVDDPRQAGSGAVVAFMHTVVQEEVSHRGLAAVLVGRALDDARGRGWLVRPVCTYVQRFLDLHPGYQDVAPEC